jgi:Holliday junction resolvase RusA-like endonuclease
VYKSASYKSWINEANVAWLLQRNKLPIKHISGRYRLEVLVHPPDMRHRDVGNLEKATSDFLQMIGMIDNDHLAKSVFFEWSDSPQANACMEVTITPYS